MHCLESADFGDDVEQAVIDVDAGLTVADGEVLATVGRRRTSDRPWAYGEDAADGADVEDTRRVTLQPYRDWGEGGAGTMRVFIPVT
ncbi:hypothetical protein BH708_04755 [Brachybacterium sp. P6-10-X1]|uniref:hypothetical protein n=1 Tax=Brachybacterium sp. P6-10-X1 TaxID=1903186 RepID=UPI000971868B|nr:hypothetical protein [Brachybacterium sp. P6-10-X1]APX32148.1 hypothetical protein BH708_04755 [Brachybacterium sp. P6-10-X1]